MKIRKLSLLIIEILLISLFNRNIVHATTTFIFFSAEPVEQEGAIFIEWETGTELDNAGFYIQRSLVETGPYLRLSGYLPSQSLNGIIGAYYSYYDNTIQVNTVYYYRIESINIDGQSAFSEVRSAVLEPSSTRTPTASVIPENTQTSVTSTSTPATIIISTSTSLPITGVPEVGTQTPDLVSPTITATPTNDLSAALGAFPARGTLSPDEIENSFSTDATATNDFNPSISSSDTQIKNQQQNSPTLLLVIYLSTIFAWIILGVIMLFIVRRISEG